MGKSCPDQQYEEMIKMNARTENGDERKGKRKVRRKKEKRRNQRKIKEKEINARLEIKLFGSLKTQSIKHERGEEKQKIAET